MLVLFYMRVCALCSRKEIVDLFEKYIANNVRHLERADAVHMLMSEFMLDKEQAEELFEAFDKDKNGQMSIWEFQQFYVCMGNQWVIHISCLS